MDFGKYTVHQRKLSKVARSWFLHEVCHKNCTSSRWTSRLKIY